MDEDEEKVGNSRDEVEVLAEWRVEKVVIETLSEGVISSSSVSMSSGKSGRPRRYSSRLGRVVVTCGDET